MLRFTLATLGMVVLLALALVVDGPFPALALVYITVFTYAMDRLSALAAPDHPEQEFPAGDGLSTLLAIAHFPLLYGGVWALVHSTATTTDKILIFLSLSLFIGQVGNSNAHELIHRSSRILRRLGTAVYASFLFGHHASAHVRVHHVHAATPRDPNSARPGESFYAFAPRAWIGGFRAGLRAESRLRQTRGWHPYVGYVGGAAASVFVAALIGGAGGVLALLAIAAYAQAQLLLSDYVQHYGLRRRELTHGKFEPVGPQHSWNAPQSFSTALMLNAPRHSDHHAHPSRPYPGLDLDRDRMPILPHSLPVMAVIALVPPLWRRLMDRRARKWRELEPAYG
ncbi:alkane 1-monooxygenase [Mameliella sp. AT18]|uniref:alkane 1-monooxygenase n=1 Tax=Mameliella sp. AT18 TaxID=3028385 RepID=UPI000841158D|nr:alkane 1-monooxygenase [Mameliella sp. AT18]MDD9730348.1 alkane 1-monooxygenase [Mameliella sp. AT18]ODM47543.1 alkane 1-monooxygenase [Ruegeria sp. PBVC088]